MADQESDTYANWSALNRAIKDAAKSAVKSGAEGTVDNHVRQAIFDRFLSRVFAAGEDSEWLLKGGVSMLARVPKSRATKDVDLAAANASDMAEAEVALAKVVSADIGDHVTFRLTGSKPTGQGENQPGVITRRLMFSCEDSATGRHVGVVPVDVVVGPAPVGRPESVQPAHRLPLKRPIPAPAYRLFPISDQVADKVCATMSTYDSRPSSRAKDLVDLVVLARTQQIDLDELREAITAKRSLGGIKAFDQFQIPPDWARTYPGLAAATPAAGGINDAAEAEEFIRQLIDPALSTDGAPGDRWLPGAGWAAAEDVTATLEDLAEQDEAGNEVHVRHHDRSGWPVREHWRAPRGTGE